jgi:hypothetical protein
MVHAVCAIVFCRDDHANRFAFGAAQAGLAEHQCHVEVQVTRHRLGVEAVHLEDVGDLAALFD